MLNNIAKKNCIRKNSWIIYTREKEDKVKNDFILITVPCHCYIILQHFVRLFSIRDSRVINSHDLMCQLVIFGLQLSKYISRQ